MKIEIWSDVVCPWCYVGKRRFEEALSRFDHRDHVEVVWRAFELDPAAAPVRPGPYTERLAGKYHVPVSEAQAMIDHMSEVGRQNGLDLNFGISQPGNTFDAHRLLHLALEQGHQDALKERLFAATFTEGQPISDRDTLVRLAAEVGLDGDEAAAALDSERFGAEVRGDEQRAARLGISAVPFFVVDGKYGVAGAQPADLLVQVLEDAWREAQTTLVEVSGGEAASCDGDACALA